MMKRKVLIVLLAFAVVCAAGAKDRNRGRGFQDFQGPAEKVSVTGNLGLSQGWIVVKNNDITYHITGLHRFIGFIDGLKEGAQVTLEGGAITSPQDAKVKILRPVKLTLGGKSYELAPDNAAPLFGYGSRVPSRGGWVCPPYRGRW